MAFIIKVLVQRGKHILLTSYTHNAVDNLLLKLSEIGVDFIRLGYSESINPKLLNYSIDSKVFKSTLEYEGKFFIFFILIKIFQEYVNSKKVVATTCLGINHPMFLRRKTFDYCIF